MLPFSLYVMQHQNLESQVYRQVVRFFQITIEKKV